MTVDLFNKAVIGGNLVFGITNQILAWKFPLVSDWFGEMFREGFGARYGEGFQEKFKKRFWKGPGNASGKI